MPLKVYGTTYDSFDDAVKGVMEKGNYDKETAKKIVGKIYHEQEGESLSVSKLVNGKWGLYKDHKIIGEYDSRKKAIEDLLKESDQSPRGKEDSKSDQTPVGDEAEFKINDSFPEHQKGELDIKSGELPKFPNEVEFNGETYYLALPQHDTLDTDLVFENRIYTKVPQILEYEGESYYITDKKEGSETDLEYEGRIYSKEYRDVNGKFGCDYCDKVFDNKNLAISHMGEHSQEEKDRIRQSNENEPLWYQNRLYLKLDKGVEVRDDDLEFNGSFYREALAKEEGSAPTVGTPSANDSPTVKSKKVLIEPKKYVQSESILVKTKEGYVGVPVFEALNKNTCQFCDGAGEIIVQDLGLKECPRCLGKGIEPEIQPVENPSITNSLVDQAPIDQKQEMNKTLPFSGDIETGNQEPKNEPVKKLNSSKENETRWIKGSKDNKWHEIDKNDRDWKFGITKEEKDKIGENFQCVACDKIFDTEEEANKHVNSHDETDFYKIKKTESKKKLNENKITECPNMRKYKDFVRSQISILEKKAKAGESVGLLFGAKIATEGKKIHGTLAYAGQSLNNRVYLGEELAKGDGMTVPLLLNHSSTAGAEAELDRLEEDARKALENGEDYQVGEVTLHWDPDRLTLFYEGEVTHPFFQKEITEANMAVSLGIYYNSDSPQYCPTDRCYTLIQGAEFREVSLVYHPGFPIATIEAVEADIRKQMATESIKAISPLFSSTTANSLNWITNTSTGNSFTHLITHVTDTNNSLKKN
jgi:uncharacterized C2H2 Zn-finger protein